MFKIKFWGVRGSIACPSPKHVVYGGNTSCIQLVLGGRQLVLDAGTGLRFLGHDFVRKNIRSAVMLLTHTHWDHITGFPFFAPFFMPDHTFDIHAGHLPEGGIRTILSNQMANPLFPVPLEAMRAELRFHDFEAGEDLFPFEDVRVRTAPLNHPNRATGYRIEYQGLSCAYVTDTEHVPGQIDPNVVRLIENADLMIYDCTYSDDEFPAKIGWGHSTWQEGIRLARHAGARRLAIFHHDPDHDDTYMEGVEDEARNIWPGAIVARDNMELTLG